MGGHDLFAEGDAREVGFIELDYIGKGGVFEGWGQDVSDGTVLYFIELGVWLLPMVR